MDDPKIVYIIDDDASIVSSLSWLIESIGLNAKSYSNAKSFLEEYHNHHNSCLLLDIRMPEISGLELQKQLKLKKINLPIIFITGHGNIPMAVNAIKEGAFNFLTKPFNDQELLDSINQALEFNKQQQINFTENEKIISLISHLTPRERQILKLMVNGINNRNIADRLNISIKTVELHRSNVMRKMKTKSIALLAKEVLIHAKDFIKEDVAAST